MSRVRWTATIGLATGIVGVLSTALPPLAHLEESVTRPLLFLVRGDVPPPPRVALVSIDESAATRMDLPTAVRDWPRSAHARLVDRLTARGASAIAFDIQFFRHNDGEADHIFADAIARSGRVVLVQRFEAGRTGDVEHWTRQEPIPLLADRAAGLAPVPMPDVPVVTWVWSFLSAPNADEIPTLPAVMLQVGALPLLPQLLNVLTRAGVDVAGGLPRTSAEIRSSTDLLRFMQALRQRVPQRKGLARAALAEGIANSGLSAEDVRLLHGLVDLYGGSTIRHLNFYGPPGRICTIPFDVALSDGSGSMCDLSGAVVFVGRGAARVARSGLEDTYHTAYPATEGVDFSGVEIHATALANLIDGSTLRPQEGWALAGLLSSVGLVMGAATYWVRTRRRWTKGATRCRLQAAAAALALSVGYCGVVYAAFSEYYVVLPVVVPLAVQLPAALVLGLLAPPARHSEQVRAVCLATDAGGSTAVGQRLPHGPYARLMDEYLQMLLQVVRQHGGEPVPPEGDGLVCVWKCAAGAGTVGHDQAPRLQACRAAIEIARAARRFNMQQPPERQLPTRIGLNVGMITVYSDADRGVFEVFGDAINVAARIRDLNRELHPRVLVSCAVTSGLEGSLALKRVADACSLKGVERPLEILEIFDTGAAASTNYAG
jgi:adenylate cyclase